MPRRQVWSRFRWFLVGSAIVAVVVPGCSAPSTETSAPAGSPPSPPLWGEFKPVVSVKELMRDMIDPLADNVFLAVNTVVSKEGTVDTVPKTEDDWQKIRTGAVGLAEGIYLLKVPRPFTPPGEDNNITGSDVVELSAAQILAKVQRDPVEWNARIEATRNAALSIMEIVKKKDVEALWGAGEDLDTTCEACHRSYWYPGEDAAFYQRLRRRLQRESNAQTPAPAAPQQKQ